MNAESIFEYIRFLENRVKELEYNESESSCSESQSEEESVTSYSINEYIASNLEIISQSYDNPYKCNAYMKAAESIRNCPFTITSGKHVMTGPNKIPGIGKKIAKQIDVLISK